jgi:murein DD-endopeptidase MepM/ murein hydrolase activator NlpD
LISNLAKGIGGRDREIAAILESLGTLSDSFASVAPEQERLLQSATRAGSAFLATKDAFARAIRAADRVFAGLGDEPEELERLLTTNDRLAREGIALLARNGDELRAGIAGLADFVNYQLREKDELIKSLRYTPDFLHAIEDASVPWRSPDGRFFYRIRAGLVMDNVESTWPCKYGELPFEYERHYFERKRREPVTTMQCVPEADATVAELAAASELVDAMSSYAAADAAVEVDLASVEVPVVAPGEGLIWPLRGVVTSPYGPREGRLHAGIDIDGVIGEPVVAAQGGRVVLAGEMSGYGTTVVVEHPDGMQTLYAHLSATAVVAGDEVDRGGLVGLVGCTGHCFGDHLHFEVHVQGIPVDPLPLLPGGPLFLTGVDLTAAPTEP